MLLTADLQPLFAAEPAARMDEMIVTDQSPYAPTTAPGVTKTQTPLRDIPAAVVVVPKEALQEQATLNMNEAMRNVSSMAPIMGGGYGFADNYVMRGLRMRFLRDGLPDGPTFNGYYRTMTGIERIEVLKGPGSALYGRSEPGGVVNVTSKAPSTEPVVELEALGGSFGTYRTSLDVGGAPAGPLATRLNAAYYHTDGFRDLSKSVIEVLPSIGWSLGDRHKFTLDYNYRHADIVADNYGILFDVNGRLLPVDRDTKYYSPMNNTEQTIHRAVLRHEATLTDAFSWRNAFAADHRDLYLLRNAGGTVNAANQSTGRQLREQEDDLDNLFAQTEGVARMATGSVEHTILGGVEAESLRIDTWRDDFALPNITDALNPVIPESTVNGLTRAPSFKRDLQSDTVAVYAQEQAAITEQLKIRGGLRYDRIFFSDEGRARFPIGSSPVTDRRIASTDDLLSWETGAVFQPVKPVSFYAGVSEGRFINIQTESPNVSTVPEESFQVETGVKTTAFQDRLQANLAFFTTRRKNYYVTLAAGGESQPVGAQKTNGMEIDVLGAPLPGLAILANYSLLNPEITSRELAGTVNIEGKRPQAVPVYSGSLWVSYEIQEGRLKGLGLGGGPSFKGNTYADAANLLKVPSYIVGDAGLFYRRPKWELQVNVKNVTNEEYFSHPTFSGAMPGDPLSVYTSLRWKI
jgi:iron complex outermembrane receptor protein